MLRRRSIRFRITAIAAAAAAAVLVVGGGVLVVFQRVALTATIDQALAQRADDLTALVVESPDLPEAFAGSAQEGFAQLVSVDGEVLVSTPNLAGSAPLPIDLDSSSRHTVQTVTGLEVDDDAFRVLSRHLEGIGILHVGTTYDVVSEAAAALTASLTATIPPLVLALAGLVWWLVGRTLRPVEAIRSEVAEIGSSDLHRRVPRPGTGDEIDRLAGTMNQMLARLETAVKRQQRFVADASHELRSPLTRMRSSLEVDLAGSDPPRSRETQDLLEDAVEMQRTVEDLLHLARADEGGVEVAFNPLDLDDLVIREARRIRSHERVEVDLSGVSGAHVLGDAGQLTRAIRNLLDNAERHAASRIALSLRESDGMATLVVADDGPGVSPDDAERVFERFSKLDEARTTGTGGTGLGLAIARDIVERHGGSLFLASVGSPGATFELRLPLAG